MSFVKGVLGLAMTAGAAFTAAKVVKKYGENKDLDIEAAAAGEEEPEEVPTGGVLSDIARAAGDVLNEAGEKVRGAAEKAGVDTEGLKEALHDAGSAVAGAGSAVASYVAEEAPIAMERLKDGAQDVLARVKESVTGIGEADEDVFPEEEDLEQAAEEAPEEDPLAEEVLAEEAALEGEAAEEAGEDAPAEENTVYEWPSSQE